MVPVSYGKDAYSGEYSLSRGAGAPSFATLTFLLESRSVMSRSLLATASRFPFSIVP